jgi:hypothetical protein
MIGEQYSQTIPLILFVASFYRSTDSTDLSLSMYLSTVLYGHKFSFLLRSGDTHLGSSADIRTWDLHFAAGRWA